jgi:bifunctional non-homologous end joining protein LigD
MQKKRPAADKLSGIKMPKGAKKAPMPGMVEPMKAKLIDKPFNDPDWVFELKWDGYRAMANVDNGKVLLYSRKLNRYTIYEEVIDELEKLPFTAVIDGEIVAYDEEGKVSFEYMQNYGSYPNAFLTYYVFDLLYFNGYSLTDVPLLERKKLLEEILPASEVIKYSEHFAEVGEKVFDFARNNDIEGVMGKKADSLYFPGKRVSDWVKIKTELFQEGIIVGYTEPKGNRPYFGGLLLAVNDKGKLKFIGSSGGGFSQKSLREIYSQLEPLKIKKNPMSEPARGVTDKINWVKPEYVCEIKFSEWTKDGLMRHPVFKGMRPDKKPEEVVLETPETKAK